MTLNNLTRQFSKVKQEDIEAVNRHKGAILWFTGLSGSGKSTIAIETELRLFNAGHRVFILDGDNLRLGLNKDLKFSAADRKENIRRAAEVACLFYKTGFIVICSFISPFIEDRDFARSLVPGNRFFEVYIECNIEECIRRDPKDLYKKALANTLNEFTGISSPYETPVKPELTLNTEELPVEQSSEMIIEMLRKFEIIGA